MRADALLDQVVDSAEPEYNFAFLDERTKRAIRRAALKGVAIPGHQVPFGSREMPIARGWGTGGLQLSLALIGPHDVFKAIDQGSDDSVNAVNIRHFVAAMSGVETVTATAEATIIQSRHRIPEETLRPDQVLVLQVPKPEPLSRIEPRVARSQKMHAEGDYASMWLSLYEGVALSGDISMGADYPAIVNGNYLMAPSPIPRWDMPKLHHAPFLTLFGAGREKRIYAVPPYTSVEPLEFSDYHFRVEEFPSPCQLCGATDTFLDEHVDPHGGGSTYSCSDTAYCAARREGSQA